MFIFLLPTPFLLPLKIKFYWFCWLQSLCLFYSLQFTSGALRQIVMLAGLLEEHPHELCQMVAGLVVQPGEGVEVHLHKMVMKLRIITIITEIPKCRKTENIPKYNHTEINKYNNTEIQQYNTTEIQ